MMDLRGRALVGKILGIGHRFWDYKEVDFIL